MSATDETVAGGNGKLTWHRVIGPDELPDGRVKTVSAGTHSFALTHYDALQTERIGNVAIRVLLNEDLA